MADIWWVVGALVLGILVGALGFWFVSRSGGAPGSSVRQLKQENEKFREEVNDHFVQTAELINRLTDSYKAVFDHLSDGAGRLVEEKVIRERMPQVSGQEIRLKPIGAPRADSPSSAEKTRSSEKSDNRPKPDNSRKPATSDQAVRSDKPTGASSPPADRSSREPTTGVSNKPASMGDSSKTGPASGTSHPESRAKAPDKKT